MRLREPAPGGTDLGKVTNVERWRPYRRSRAGRQERQEAWCGGAGGAVCYDVGSTRRRPIREARRVGHLVRHAARFRNSRSISARVNGREPRRPNTAIWPPVSSTARSRSRPLDSASAGRRGLRPGDQLGHRRGREAVEVGLAVGAGQLEHLHPVAAVGDVGEQRGVGEPTMTSSASFMRAAEGHLLVDARRCGIGDVDDHQPVLLGGDIGVGAGDIEPPRVGQRHGRAEGTGRGSRQVG